MRGFHQGWEGTVLPDKAEYMSATDSHVVVLTDHLAMGSGPYMSQSLRTIPDIETFAHEKYH